MNIFKYIPYIIILILLVAVGYQQFSFKNQLADIQKTLIANQSALYKYQLEQKDNQIKIISEINSYNNERFGELNEKLNEINNISNNNRKLINGLQQTTNSYETNYNNFTESTRLQYISTINKLFNESTELLTEIAGEADRSTEAAIAYKDILDKNYQIINDHNQETK